MSGSPRCSTSTGYRTISLDTAPSKRLEARIPSYQKTVHGPLVVEATGLAKLRAACPRFHDWVTKLEGLLGNAAR